MLDLSDGAVLHPAEIRTAERKLYLFVLIGRPYIKVRVRAACEDHRMDVLVRFPGAPVAAVPDKIPTVLTENGTGFTFPPC